MVKGMDQSDCRKILAFAKKEFLNDTSYFLSFLSRWIGIALSVFMFYYFSKLVGGRGSTSLSIYGGDYFSFVMVGMAAVSFLTSGFNGFPSTVGREQNSGILEVLLTTPTKIHVFLLAFSGYNIFMGLLALLFYLFLGRILGMSLQEVNVLAMLVVLFLAIVIFLSLGIVSAAFGIMFKRGDPIRWIIGNLFWLLGGLYFPISVLPAFLQKVSFFIPSTYVLRSLRLAFLKNYSVFLLKEDILILLAMACFSLLLSILIFKKALRWACVKGTISLV